MHADVKTAMQSGMFWGYTGMIEGILKKIIAELSPEHQKMVLHDNAAKLYNIAI